ncbi:Fibronectin type III domain protein (fragment) [Capnocytophaga canimorsus]|uniref:Fibronectin type III domain protein n=1 Tax=Capnocytophaga canimorsus TaxID=28188 RepID=A0A0B7H5G6_9FLAO
MELTKPDKIPPSTPIFTGYTQEKNHWKITWQQSFDDDVTHYHLYRKEKEATQWHKIHSEKHSHQESYTYKEPATLSGTFVYSLRAEDRSGNFSEYAPVIHIHHNPLTDTRVLRGLNSRVGQGKIELRWDKLKVAISEIVIYKAIKGEKPTLWRSFSQPVTSAEDTDIAPDTTYQYLIKVILQDQSPTPTEKIEVFVKEFGGI